MRRTLRPVNRNNSRINNLHRQQKPANNGSPSTRRSFWLKDDNTLLEDIETISLHNSSSSDERPKRTISQPWNDSFQREYRASEKKWQNNDLVKRFQAKNPLPNKDHGDGTLTDHIYTGYYDGRSNNIDDTNRHMTCFTIINRHDAMNSESSTDNELYESNYLTQYENGIISNATNDVDKKTKSYEEIATAVDGTDADKETRTIWIYSFKNRKDLFTEDDDLVNMASRSSSSSYLQDIHEEKPSSGNSFNNMGSTRVATPIPPSFAPRFDPLLSTLPTVTEVSEVQSVNDGFKQKKSAKDIEERKRSENSRKSKDDTKTSHASKQFDLLEFSVEESIENLNKQLQTAKRNVSSQTEFSLIIPLLQEAKKIKNSTLRLKENITEHTNLKTIFSTNEMEFLDDSSPINQQSSSFSSPNEKAVNIDSKTWIEDAKSDEKHATYTKEYSEYRNSAGHRLMVKNAALLKPASQWADYYPSESVPSLVLSLGETDYGDSEMRWWRKALNCILCVKCR